MKFLRWMTALRTQFFASNGHLKAISVNGKRVIAERKRFRALFIFIKTYDLILISFFLVVKSFITDFYSEQRIYKVILRIEINKVCANDDNFEFKLIG